MENEDWRVWDEEKEYGDVFFKRATGSLPEMESSKAAAKAVNKIISDQDSLLDVGCGTGHYLKSLISGVDKSFSYTGADATGYYIELATKAWSGVADSNENVLSVKFKQADIFNLPFEDQYADVVMCNNVLLHLPSVATPIQELIRTAKKYVVIRALIGNSTFRTKQVHEPEVFDENGEPENFHFYNIYSENYISSLLNGNDCVKSFSFSSDTDYNVDNITKSMTDYSEEPTDITTIVNGMQVNNYIIQPWQFLIIEIK